MIRLINLVAIALFIIMLVIFAKYKLVCEVTIDGESLGYIANKEQFEQSIQDYIDKDEANKVETIIENMPEYKVTLIDNSKETNEEVILAKLEENSQTTYKFYAVTVDGKEKATVADLEEAEELVKELSTTYEKKLDVKIGIVEKMTTNNTDGVKTIKTAEADITKELKAEVKKKEEKEAAERAKYEATYTSTTTVASLNGVKLTVTPVSGVITSRFGNRESIRSYAHSGLDIGAPKGTDIKAAASGTVAFAGWSGGYGNIVKISHGSGIQTYYAHCSELYVSTGDEVKAGDVIAAVGSTGNSTGNHLHFEVIKNGTSLNPQHYLYK